MSNVPTPSGWQRSELGSVVDVLDSLRVPVSTEEREKRVGHIPYYGANGLQGFIDVALFNEPLILLAEDGGNFDDFTNRSIAYRIDGPAWVNNHAHVLRVIEGTSQGFVFHSLEHRDIRRYISGGTRTKLTQTELRSIRVLLPPYDEQRRITEILDTVDAAIRSTERLVAKLKQTKEAVQRDLLSRGIDESGRLRDPIRGEFKNTILGPIPMRWSILTLDEACCLVQDGTHLPPPRVDDGPLLLSVRNMIGGQLVETNSDTRVPWSFFHAMHRKWEVRRGDVLLAVVGATVGKTAVVGTLPPFTIQRSVTVLRGREGIVDNRYLVETLAAPEFQRQIWAAVNQTAQPGIYLAELKKLFVLVPPLDEQRQICEALAAISTRIETSLVNLKGLRLLKKGLTDDLLTGGVRVNTTGETSV